MVEPKKYGIYYYVPTLVHYTRLYLIEVGRMNEKECIVGWGYNSPDLRLSIGRHPKHYIKKKLSILRNINVGREDLKEIHNRNSRLAYIKSNL